MLPLDEGLVKPLHRKRAIEDLAEVVSAISVSLVVMTASTADPPCTRASYPARTAVALVIPATITFSASTPGGLG